jgi:hypothetical protein
MTRVMKSIRAINSLKSCMKEYGKAKLKLDGYFVLKVLLEFYRRVRG